MKKVQVFFIIFLLLNPMQGNQQIGFAFSPYPDVIKCVNYFYYIQFSSSAEARYSGMTGSAATQGYLVKNGVLQKLGNVIAESCADETIESMWTSNRAFRIFNLGRAPDRSIINTFPDVVKCGDDVVFLDLVFGVTKIYRKSSGGRSMNKAGLNDAGTEFNGLDCGGKTLAQLITDGQAFNVVSEEVTTQQASSIFSMSSKYPDAIKCNSGFNLFIHHFNDERAVYRSFTQSGVEEAVVDKDGNFRISRGSTTVGCNGKTFSQLMGESRVLNFNTPVLSCPSEISSNDPIVEYSIGIPSEYTVVSTPPSKTFFPYGQTTTVSVQATHSSNLNFSCIFDVKIGPDTLPPTINCPQNIKQKNPLVDFEASATDNDILNQVKISYDKAPKTQFPTGETTKVTVTAVDDSGNEAICTFTVQIDKKQIEIVSQISTNNKFQKEDPKPQLQSQSQGSNVGIIIGAVAAGLAVIISVVILIFCKKYKMACFKKKTEQPKRLNFKKKVRPQDDDQAQEKISDPETVERFHQ